MSETDIKILSGEDAADVMNGRDDLARRFVGEFAVTQKRLAQTDVGEREEIIADRTANLFTKFHNKVASIILHNDQIAGMAYYGEAGQLGGRRVYEIGGNVVLPEFRGNHYSARLAESCLDRVFAVDNNAYAVGVSVEKPIKDRYAQWVDAGLAIYMEPMDYLRMVQEFYNSPIRDEVLARLLPGYANAKIILIDLQKWDTQKGKAL
jgi:hypothetical protein